MKKRLMVLLLILAMCVITVPFTAYANSTKIDTWDGSTDITWYDASKTEFQLETAEQLAGLAELVNNGENFQGKSIFLKTDVNLDDQEWTPIGKGYMDWDKEEASLGFTGTFNGENHVISGLKVTVNTSASNNGDNLGAAALFGYLLGGTVKNVIVKGSVSVTNDVDMGNNAGIVGYSAGGTIENCINYATISGHYTAGGIVGICEDSVIAKCMNYGDVTGYPSGNGRAGGIVGEMYGKEIRLCQNIGTITSFTTKHGSYVGGIAGALDSQDQNLIQMISCYNSGIVQTNYAATAIGGIVGSAYICNMTGCYNDGYVDVSQCQVPKEHNSGAIVGFGAESNIYNTYYLDTSYTQGCGSDATFETNEIEAKTSEQVKGEDFLAQLNQNSLVWAFAPGTTDLSFLYSLPADYSKVDDAKKKIPTKLTDYTDATVDVLKLAVNSVVLGKMADEQEAVDAMAKAIEDAIKGLKKRSVTPSYYYLTVNNGTGSGYYPYGRKVDITADPAPEGMRFKEWTATEGTIADPKAEATTFTVPVGGAEVTAVYEKELQLTIPTVKVSTTYNSVKLTWKAVRDAEGYQIYRASSKDGTYKRIAVTSKTTFTNKKLTTGKGRYYKVRAYGPMDGIRQYGEFSKAVKGIPKTKAPAFTLKKGDNSIKISWKRVSGATGYRIYRASSKNGKFKLIKGAGSKLRSYTSYKLRDHHTYYYKMRSYRMVNGKKIYSNSSKVKQITIK